MTVREPRYTDQDRAELLALALYRESLCPLHGGPRSECQATEGHIPDFDVSSTYCQATVSLIEAQNAVGSSPNRYAGARLWTTSRKG